MRLASSLTLLFVLLSAGAAERAGATQLLHLPFSGGTAVQIIQGYNGGTHNGVERFSLDLVRADGATSGSPVVASASGTVAFAQLPGDEHGCIGVAMDDAAGLHYMLCHVMLNRAYSYGDRIELGQVLGTIGAAGLVGNNGTPHVHLQLYVLPGGVRTPVAFAAPEGIPLEGVSLPADGSPNQWACVGVGCRPLTASNAGPVRPTSAASPPASSPPPGQSGVLATGKLAYVQGTGDCLRAHAQPHLASPQMGCAEDGTLVTVVDGPVEADGFTWWKLFMLGWSVSDYLRPTGVGVQDSTPASTGAAAGFPVPPVTSIPSSPRPAAIGVGVAVRVAGTGDCLILRAAPALSAAPVGCLPDGTLALVRDGPQAWEGHTWWLLDAGGWAAADYLQPAIPP